MRISFRPTSFYSSRSPIPSMALDCCAAALRAALLVALVPSACDRARCARAASPRCSPRTVVQPAMVAFRGWLEGLRRRRRRCRFVRSRPPGTRVRAFPAHGFRVTASSAAFPRCLRRVRSVPLRRRSSDVPPRDSHRVGVRFSEGRNFYRFMLDLTRKNFYRFIVISAKKLLRLGPHEMSGTVL